VKGAQLLALSLNELSRAYAGSPSSNYLTEQKTREAINSRIWCELFSLGFCPILILIPAPVRPVLCLSLCCCSLINEYSLSGSHPLQLPILLVMLVVLATFAHCDRMVFSCSFATWSCQDAYVVIWAPGWQFRALLTYKQSGCGEAHKWHTHAHTLLHTISDSTVKGRAEKVCGWNGGKKQKKRSYMSESQWRCPFKIASHT